MDNNLLKSSFIDINNDNLIIDNYDINIGEDNTNILSISSKLNCLADSTFTKVNIDGNLDASGVTISDK